MPPHYMRGYLTACLEAIERKYNNRTFEENATAWAITLVSAGLKSHLLGLSPDEEKGSATLRSVVQSSRIGNHSPEHKWTKSGLNAMRRSSRQRKLGQNSEHWGAMAGMVVNALFHYQGRPVNVFHEIESKPYKFLGNQIR